MVPVVQKGPQPSFSGSYLIMIGLAVISLVVYTAIWNIQYAALIMVSLLVHEMGHVWALWHYGLRVRGMYFIPLLGAAVVAKDRVPTGVGFVFFALMGPALGYFLAVLAHILFVMTGNVVWVAVAGWMVILNLLNMFPISPLDGGRAWKVMVRIFPTPLRTVLIAAPIACMAYASYWTGSWILWAFFAVFILFNVYESVFNYWRKTDHIRVRLALAKLLNVEEPTTENVISRIEELYVETQLFSTDRMMHAQFLDEDFLREVQGSLKEYPFENHVQSQNAILRIVVQHVAFDARYIFWVRGKKRFVNATTNDELHVPALDEFAKSNLFAYLHAENENPKLHWVHVVTIFVGYCLLTYGMLSLLALAKLVPGMGEAMMEIMK